VFRAGLNSPGRPVGNLLFLGPTGAGKTRVVEATAEVLFGDPRAVIKVDCAEFQHSHEIAKLIGSPPGYLGHRETHPLITQEALAQYHTEKLKISFLLFDEIEKASDALWQLPLGILDKGNSVAHSSAEPQLLRDAFVLNVDDNETNRIILVDRLMKWGIVESAESAEGALSILERGLQAARHFSLIITDLHMPLVDGFGLVEALGKKTVLAPIPMLLLSLSTQPDDRARARELGNAAFSIKPVQASELLDAVLNALSVTTNPEMPQAPPALLPYGEGGRMKILLAEDNAGNRTLARKLLEKHGHTIVLAENGREALDALDRETVDLVLMDLQMPVMDGLEAIAAVRKKEMGTGVHLPIVALTAHAMKGDRERCLAAGADDYLTKPIHTPGLFAALERIQTVKITEGSPPRTAPTTTTNATISSLDMMDALQRVEGDSELFEEMARIFVDECAKIMAEIRCALDAPDAHLLEQSAHRLKGSSSTLGAKLLAQSASELELMARAGDLRSARLQFITVEAEVNKLFVELEAISRKAAR
jgi:CheY-like chemotaxis protein/HPt (histidine-containing phosphotransfer) domain-containing protein